MQAVVTAAMAVQTLLFAATAAPPAALFPSPTSARPFHRASNFRGASIRPSPPQRPSAASPVLPLAVEEDKAAAAGAGEGQRRGGGSSNRIQVSNTKKPLFFYVNLAKRYMQQHGEVELSALGIAIATVVTVAEILKNNGLAVEKKIRTSTVEINDESRGRPLQKAKTEIVVGKSDKFDELMAAAAEEREAGDGEEQA